VNEFVAWFAEIRHRPGRAALVALGLFYVARVWTTAPDTGQLFNFTMIGIAEGCLFAIAASGLVLTYATTGVFNFAHGAVGMVSAYMFYALTVQHDVPTFLAVLIVLVVFAPLVGLATERVMRSFRDADVQTTVVVTIALFVMCIGLAQKFWPPETGARLDTLIGKSGDNVVHIWKASLTYDNVAAIVLAVVVAVMLRSLLYGSRTGVAMRAVVDNPTLAGLNGAPPITIARYSWVLGNVLAALSGVLLAVGTTLDPIVLTLFVAGAYGAAVVGKLKSLPLTFAGALALGVLKQQATFALPDSSTWQSLRIAIPGIFLFAALLLVPAAKLSVGRVVRASAPRVPSLQSSVVRATVFVAAAFALSRLAPGDRHHDRVRVRRAPALVGAAHWVQRTGLPLPVRVRHDRRVGHGNLLRRPQRLGNASRRPGGGTARRDHRPARVAPPGSLSRARHVRFRQCGRRCAHEERALLRHGSCGGRAAAPVRCPLRRRARVPRLVRWRSRFSP
jgi:branched-subunit amino acid ABC-type transport system permease component